jgi:hypothetical protein
MDDELHESAKSQVKSQAQSDFILEQSLGGEPLGRTTGNL